MLGSVAFSLKKWLKFILQKCSNSAFLEKGDFLCPSYSYSKLKTLDIYGIIDRAGLSVISYNLYNSQFSAGFYSFSPIGKHLNPLMVRWLLTSILMHILHEFIHNVLFVRLCFTKIMLEIIKNANLFISKSFFKGPTKLDFSWFYFLKILFP